MEFDNEGVLLGPRTLITVETPAMRRTAAATAKTRRGWVHVNRARRRSPSNVGSARPWAATMSLHASSIERGGSCVTGLAWRIRSENRSFGIGIFLYAIDVAGHNNRMLESLKRSVIANIHRVV